jgi:FkbM family methyltransferase
MEIKEKLLHHFIKDFIDENSIIVDLGGNKGEFSKFIVDEFMATAYVIEPIPELFNQIPEHPKIKKFQYCISQEKDVEISILENQCATIYDKNFNKKIICKGITLEDFLKENNIKKVDLLKVDIEGAEIEMFENLSEEILKNINQITVEFHDFLWPELKPKVELIKNKIKNLGFYCIPFSITNNGDVLFIKKNLISKLQYLYLKYFERFRKGFIRRIKRYLKINV